MKKAAVLAGILSTGFMLAPLSFAEDLLGTVQSGLDKTQQGVDTLQQGQQLLGSGEEAKAAVTEAVQDQATKKVVEAAGGPETTTAVQEKMEAVKTGQDLLKHPDVATEAATEAATQKATDTASDAAVKGVGKLLGD